MSDTPPAEPGHGALDMTESTCYSASMRVSQGAPDNIERSEFAQSAEMPASPHHPACLPCAYPQGAWPSRLDPVTRQVTQVWVGPDLGKVRGRLFHRLASQVLLQLSYRSRRIESEFSGRVT